MKRDNLPHAHFVARVYFLALRPPLNRVEDENEAILSEAHAYHPSGQYAS